MHNSLSRNLSLIRGLILRLALAITLFSPSLAVIAAPQDITEVEMKLLPRYCPDTATFNSDATREAYWRSMMGRAFSALHHYCWGQITMMRSRKAGVPAHIRQGMWESAVGDYSYVIRNSQADFILLPEIYTRLGEVELLLGHTDKANQAFARARQLKPDYWPAYSRWAEYLMRTGKRPEALKVVVTGLQHSPDAKVLREQFRVLGGKPSDLRNPVAKQPTGTDPVPGTEAVVPGDTPEPEVRTEPGAKTGDN
jgi:tetratricopeptide (TPR) repeat protein